MQNLFYIDKQPTNISICIGPTTNIEKDFIGKYFLLNNHFKFMH